MVITHPIVQIVKGPRMDLRVLLGTLEAGGGKVEDGGIFIGLADDAKQVGLLP